MTIKEVLLIVGLMKHHQTRLLYEGGHTADGAKFIEQHSKAECDVITVGPEMGESARYSKKNDEFQLRHI